MSEVFARVQQIAADLFQLPPSQITAQSSPETIEAWDSVEQLNLILALEQAFNLRFDPNEIDHMNSLGSITSLVERKLQSPS